MTRLGRLFFTYRWVQTAVMSLAAVSISASLGSLAPAAFTTLDHGWYDLWTRTHHEADSSPLLVAVRDARSEELLGEGPWDRADIARLVSALHEAGARAIGLDVPLAIPSPPTQGGAAGDALLLEAVSAAGSVVYRDAGLSQLD